MSAMLVLVSGCIGLILASGNDSPSIDGGEELSEWLFESKCLVPY